MRKKRDIIVMAKAIGRPEEEIWNMETQEYYEQLNVLEQLNPREGLNGIEQ